MSKKKKKVKPKPQKSSKGSVNKYGLKRDIPSDVKRKVRQRDGYGCVICATPIINYEHVDPVFSEAQEHNADCITLLCPSHHEEVNKKLISKEIVKEAMKNPAANKAGMVSRKILLTKSHPRVMLGKTIISECEIPIMFRDKPIISITREDGSYLLNVHLWDSKGVKSLEIINNEWFVSKNNVWDLQIEGNRFTIHEKERKPCLIFSLEDNNTLKIEKLDMMIDRYHILINQDTLDINSNIYGATLISNCKCGIRLG